MDLAKIRQKARQEQEQSQLEETQPEQVNLQPNVTPSVKAEISESIFGSDDDIWTLRATEEEKLRVSSSVSDPGLLQSFQTNYPSIPVCNPPPQDPFKVILAGRTAAGCDEELLLVPEEHADTVVKEYQEYLCFRVSDETYGINIMDIKEIIKPREVTEVPRAPSFVSGIISLRGIIIPIIDMMNRLGLPRETVTGRERVIVVRNGEAFSGLLVDEIFQVVHIAKDCMESAPAVLDGIDRDFVTGIGRADGRMIILLNLENIADIHLY